MNDGGWRDDTQGEGEGEEEHGQSRGYNVPCDGKNHSTIPFVQWAMK
jgi:hypothetical protein